METNFYLEKLLRLKSNFSVKLITGILGAGKSTLLKAFAETLLNQGVTPKEIIFIDCVTDIRPKNFQVLYNLVTERTAELEKFYLIIDDIDCVNDWEKAINALFVGTPAEIYVAGSSGTLVEKISTLLPENCDVLKVYPPSFSEYAKNFPPEKSSEALQKYLHFGGLPITVDADEKFLPTILRGIAYEILFDIAAKNSLRNIDIFRSIVKQFALNTGRITSLNGVLKDLKRFGYSPNFNSVKNYFGGGAGLFLQVPSFDLKKNRFPVGIEKFFCIDNGLLRAFRNFDDIDETILIENAVCTELLRRGFDLSCGKFGTMRVSFIATRGDEKIFIQVLPTDGRLSVRRATRPLRFMAQTGEKILISIKPERDYDDVKNITLQDFLLGA